jgi:hypothetical protein
MRRKKGKNCLIINFQNIGLMSTNGFQFIWKTNHNVTITHIHNLLLFDTSNHKVRMIEVHQGDTTAILMQGINKSNQQALFKCFTKIKFNWWTSWKRIRLNHNTSFHRFICLTILIYENVNKKKEKNKKGETS